MPRSLPHRCMTVLLWFVTSIPPAIGQNNQWEELDRRVTALYTQGHYSEALTVAEQALSMAQTSFGKDSSAVARSENILALTQEALGSYKKAETLFLDAVRIYELEKDPAREAIELAPLLANLSGLYQATGDYEKAEPFSRRALTLRESHLGAWHHDVANSLINLGLIYEAEGKYPEAEGFLKRALEIMQKVLSPEDPELGMVLNDVGALYGSWQRYGEAESLLNRALEVEQKTQANHPDIIFPFTNLADVYAAEGNYNAADSLYRRAIEIEVNAVGPEHPILAKLYAGLASLDLERLGDNHMSPRDVVEHMAFGSNADHWSPKPEETEMLLKGVLQINLTAFGEKHPEVAAAAASLGRFYLRTEKYDLAETLFKDATAIYLPDLRHNALQVADLLADFAELDTVQQKYSDAESSYRLALKTEEEFLSPEDKRLTALRGKIAKFYYSQQKYDEAASLFDRVIADRRKQFEYELNYMSGRSRLSFLDTTTADFDNYFSFYFTRRMQDPLSGPKMYDAALWQKDMAARDVAAIRTRIAGSRDPVALSLFDHATALKTRLGALPKATANNMEEWQIAVKNLQAQIDAIDGELIRRAGALSTGIRLQATTWRDVQEKLKTDEAAVEFLWFQYQETFQYAALVLKGGSTTQPILIPIVEEHNNELESAIDDYWQMIRKVPKPGAGRDLHRIVWEPLEPYLERCRRVYVSPAGDLDAVSFGLLPDKNGRLVMEDHEIALVSSTKDLLQTPSLASARTAILLGNPLFDLSEAQQRAALRKLKPDEQAVIKDTTAELIVTPPSDPSEKQHLEPLQGAKEEMRLVQSLLKKRGWHVKAYPEDLAQVEVLQAVRGPRVLHIATHGFFESYSEGVIEFLLKGRSPIFQKDPMLRSGLYFAGANRIPPGHMQSGDLHTGVFTALEATALDLRGTELVVLSGCETGSGATNDGRAVFGFRRALQDAGAESVLMSLWSIPDDETQELMTLFYEKWLGGADKVDALRDSELALRERVKKRWGGEDRPYYWGAFVLVGR